MVPGAASYGNKSNIRFFSLKYEYAMCRPKKIICATVILTKTEVHRGHSASGAAAAAVPEASDDIVENKSNNVHGFDTVVQIQSRGIDAMVINELTTWVTGWRIGYQLSSGSLKTSSYWHTEERQAKRKSEVEQT